MIQCIPLFALLVEARTPLSHFLVVLLAPQQISMRMPTLLCFLYSLYFPFRNDTYLTKSSKTTKVSELEILQRSLKFFNTKITTSVFKYVVVIW